MSCAASEQSPDESRSFHTTQIENRLDIKIKDLTFLFPCNKSINWISIYVLAYARY